MRTLAWDSYFILTVYSLLLCGCSESVPVSNSTPAKPIVFQGPSDVLIPGQYHADIMVLGGTPRYVELATRMKESIKNDPTLISMVALKAKSGEPLPYDSRLGLTKAEYDEFLATKLTMIQTEEFLLTITQSGENVFRLEGENLPKDLVGIEIDLNKDQVRTPFGVLGSRSPIHADSTTAIGEWDGVQWKSDGFSLSGLSVATVKFCVGVRKNSRQCVVNYDAKSMGLGDKTRISHTLYYDLPETP